MPRTQRKTVPVEWVLVVMLLLSVLVYSLNGLEDKIRRKSRLQALSTQSEWELVNSLEGADTDKRIQLLVVEELTRRFRLASYTVRRVTQLLTADDEQLVAVALDCLRKNHTHLVAWDKERISKCATATGSISVRAKAIAILVCFDEYDAEVTKMLKQALEDRRDGECEVIARELHSDVETMRKCEFFYVGLLRHPNRWARSRGAKELVWIHAGSDVVIPEMISLLNDPEVSVRTCAIKCIEEDASHAGPALPHLWRISREDRACAEQALQTIGVIREKQRSDGMGGYP